MFNNYFPKIVPFIR